MLKSRMVRAWIQDSLSAVLYGVGLTKFARTSRDQLTIVTFHRVLPASQLSAYPIRSIAVTPDELRWVIEALTPHFVCAPLRDAARMWRRGDCVKPPLAVTFDDGQLDNFVHARPVLAALGVKATFFATVQGAETRDLLWHDKMAYAFVHMLGRRDSHVGGLEELWGAFDQSLSTELRCANDRHAAAARAVESAKSWSSTRRRDWLAVAEAALGNVVPTWDGMMSASELRTMAEEGHEIGCHSRSHDILPNLDDATLQDEIVGSKAALEAMTGQPCVTFCYPNGDYDGRCAKLVGDQYEFGVTTRWGVNAPSAENPTLSRIDIVANNLGSRSGTLSLPKLAWKMSSLYPGPRS